MESRTSRFDSTKQPKTSSAVLHSAEFKTRRTALKMETSEPDLFEWDKHSVGLVLSGGGAKGAYEIGCWQAFQKAGIKQFAAISGTSIGGINAYLVSRGDLSSAERLWQKIVEGNPFKRVWARIAIALFERLGLAIFFSLYVWMFLPAVALVGLAIGAGLPFLVGFALKGSSIFDARNPIEPIFFPTVILAVLVAERLLSHTRLGRITRQNIRHSARNTKRQIRNLTVARFSFVVGVTLGILLPVGVVLYDILLYHQSPYLLVLLAYCLALDILIVIANSEVGLSSTGDISLFSGEPLVALLRNEIPETGFQPAWPSLYLTRLREATIEYPGAVPEWVLKEVRDRLSRSGLGLEDIELARQMIDQLGLKSYFTNAADTALGLEYQHLEGVAMSKVRDYLLSTSAIAGFLPRIEERLSAVEEGDIYIRGQRAVFYDAGLVDNIPLAPLIENENCSIIIVVFLDHRIRDAKKFLVDHMDRINSRIRRFNSHLSDEAYEQLKHLRFLSPVRIDKAKLRETDVIAVVPSQPLGGFLNGTLRFNRERVRKHMEMGERDTMKAICDFVNRRSHGKVKS